MASLLISDLQQLNGTRAGGKAEGLALLQKEGMNIPRTMVILSPDESSLDTVVSEIVKQYDEMPLAIRSSAMDEDSEGASFAGQFETYLNVTGRDNIGEAIRECIHSVKSGRVTNYAHSLKPEADLKMSVVVQEMIDPRAAGVIFTADPVTGRRDHSVINVVPGLGEELVSGHQSGQQFLLSRSGKILKSTADESDEILDYTEMLNLLEGAGRMEEKTGIPQDLEWAIDKKGNLFWLQSRPITTLPPVHLNEMDSSFFDESEPVLTRGNVGEMMPGPVTPLTESIFGYGIDIGLQRFYHAMGVQEKPKKGTRRYIYSFYNHLFFSMSRMYIMAERVLSVSKETVDYGITGEILDTPWKRPEPRGFIISRLIRFIKYFIFISKAPKVLKKLKKKVDTFNLNLTDSITGLYSQLEDAREFMADAWYDHYCTSGQSGALESIAIQVLSGGKQIPDTEQYRQMASLLVNIDNIDGANALASQDDIVEALRKEKDVEKEFLNVSEEAGYDWLMGEESGEGGRLFHEFMRVNGHRCIREAELIERSWAQEPLPLVKLFQNRVRHFQEKKRKEAPSFEENFAVVLEGQGRIQRVVLKNQIPKLRLAVARRENSKSLCIKLNSKIKDGYLALADLLVEKKLLEKRDHVYFLTHQELGILVNNSEFQLKEKAAARSRLFPAMKELVFEDHYYHYPEPVEYDLPVEIPEGALTGLPVSNGKIQAPVRIINSIEEAQHIEHGEIMVAALTDIGWTPYFSIISGLITEIGSSLSHGAVVAREYGIPAVVNIKNARKMLKTGDRVELDGANGRVTLLDK